MSRIIPKASLFSLLPSIPSAAATTASVPWKHLVLLSGLSPLPGMCFPQVWLIYILSKSPPQRVPPHPAALCPMLIPALELSPRTNAVTYVLLLCLLCVICHVLSVSFQDSVPSQYPFTHSLIQCLSALWPGMAAALSVAVVMVYLISL